MRKTSSDIRTVAQLFCLQYKNKLFLVITHLFRHFCGEFILLLSLDIYRSHSKQDLDIINIKILTDYHLAMQKIYCAYCIHCTMPTNFLRRFRLHCRLKSAGCSQQKIDMGIKEEQHKMLYRRFQKFFSQPNQGI